MTLFEEILKEQGLLLEAVNDQNIIKAINNMLHVRITYNDKQGGKGKMKRYIYPVAYGINHKGNKVIRAYETFGSTKRGLKPTDTTPDGNPWKLFKLDNIVSWTNGKRSFKNEIGSLIQQGLKTTEDKGIANLIAIVPVGGQQPIDPLGSKGSEPVSKGNIEQPNIAQPQPQTTEPNVDNVAGQTTSTDWANQYNQEKGQGISLDNNGNVVYNKDIEKINAPETTPVTKSDITPEPQVTEPQPEQTPEPEVANDEPVEKTDVQPQNDITPTFRDYMYR